MTGKPITAAEIHEARLLRLDGYSIADTARAMQISYGRARRLVKMGKVK